MQKFTLLTTALLATVITGCASAPVKTLSTSAIKQNNPSSIVMSKREAPSFLATTALNVQFGLLGVAAQMASGNKIIKENQVEDPAIYIANELAKSLGESLDIENIKTSAIVTKAGKPQVLAEEYKGSDLLLDVQTVGWQSIYYTSDWNNYRVIYNAKLRVIDTKTKTLLAESNCVKKQDDKANAPSYDQMIENNATVLKAILKAHADECIAEFKTNALGMK